jgi:hypothetical protein
LWKVAEFFDRAVKITSAIKKETGPKIKDFRAALKVRHDPHPHRPTAVSFVCDRDLRSRH